MIIYYLINGKKTKLTYLAILVVKTITKIDTSVNNMFCNILL